MNPWDVLLGHTDGRCATEYILLRPGLAWLQWSRTSFRCAQLNTDVDPRTRDESLRLAKKKKIVDSTLEAGVLNACVFSDFQRYRTKGAWLHARFAWSTSVQTYSSDNGSDIEHFLGDKRDLWPGFSTKLEPEVDCATTIAMAELAIRTVMSAPATEAGIEMNLTRMSIRFHEKLDFATGDKSCFNDSHLKVSRSEILLVNLLVQLVQLPAC